MHHVRLIEATDEAHVALDDRVYEAIDELGRAPDDLRFTSTTVVPGPNYLVLHSALLIWY